MDQQNNSLWSNVLSAIKDDLNNEHAYHIWFDPIKYVNRSENAIQVEVPNRFYKEWLVERYHDLIGRAVERIYGKRLIVEFIIKEGADAIQQYEQKNRKSHRGFWPANIFQQKAKPGSTGQLDLNFKYTFDNFVVGPGNRFAHAASLAVTETPAKAYNPLFIYGGVGLGKTHLMRAIGQRALELHQKLKILYISSEDFTNQLIHAIQNRSTLKFRQTYRNLDILMIDDVHFIAGKESTQEEFFHTFNTLYEAHKQIIVSSDRSPKEIPSLEKRLVSRFGWGLVTDIQPPDFETRTAILKKKQESNSVAVPDDVLYFLAEKIQSNIRELEGALIRVVAYVTLIGKEITLDLAKEVLKDMIIEEEKKVTIDAIQKKVADHFNIGVSDMKVKKRTRAIAYPRQVAMYLCRRLTDHSLPEIGEHFGGRDHTTVIHACDKIKSDITAGKSVKNIIDRLTQDIRKS